MLLLLLLLSLHLHLSCFLLITLFLIPSSSTNPLLSSPALLSPRHRGPITTISPLSPALRSSHLLSDAGGAAQSRAFQERTSLARDHSRGRGQAARAGASPAERADQIVSASFPAQCPAGGFQVADTFPAIFPLQSHPTFSSLSPRAPLSPVSSPALPLLLSFSALRDTEPLREALEETKAAKEELFREGQRLMEDKQNLEATLKT
eukprot:762461-Hanusia_phi.AAC.2